MFSALTEKLKKIDALSDAEAFKFLQRNDSLKERIIYLNTDEQLYNQGVDSLNRLIGKYAPSTKQIKAARGQRNDHITLRDTGEFYESFRVVPSGDALLIKANPIKDDDNLFELYGKDIVGLTQGSKESLRIQVRELLKAYIRLKTR